MNNLIKLLEEKNIGKVLENESLKKYNTYKIGGIAKLVVFPDSVEKLVDLLHIIKDNNIKYKVIGKGSNLIFSSKKFDGIIIKLDKLDNIKINGTKVVVGAGYSLVRLALETAKRGLSGLEFAAGIPGTVGGSVYMNAGAYKNDIGELIETIKVIDDNLNIIEMKKEDLDFNYRHSFLQEHKDYICLEVTLNLIEADIYEIKEKINKRKNKRMETQPLEYPSAGSVFRNPEDIPAGKLIEDAGLKGKTIGGAMVSIKHANFIINYDNATSEDVYNLINYVKEEVKKQTGVELRQEQEFVNWE